MLVSLDYWSLSKVEHPVTRKKALKQDQRIDKLDKSASSSSSYSLPTSQQATLLHTEKCGSAYRLAKTNEREQIPDKLLAHHEPSHLQPVEPQGEGKPVNEPHPWGRTETETRDRQIPTLTCISAPEDHEGALPFHFSFLFVQRDQKNRDAPTQPAAAATTTTTTALMITNHST